MGQPGFYAYFGLTASPKDASLYAYSNRIIGAINGLYSAGGTFGALGMAWLCESKGRKMALYVACVFGIVGGALQAGSVHIAMYLVARLITGVAVGKMYSVLDTDLGLTSDSGAFVTLVPLFQAEIAPPASRGFLVAQHGESRLPQLCIVILINQALSSSQATRSQLGSDFPVTIRKIFPFNGDSPFPSKSYGPSLCFVSLHGSPNLLDGVGLIPLRLDSTC